MSCASSYCANKLSNSHNVTKSQWTANVLKQLYATYLKQSKKPIIANYVSNLYFGQTDTDKSIQ